MLEYVIIALVVAGAAFFVVRSLHRTLAGKSSPACWACPYREECQNRKAPPNE